jgi:PAS domain S-box-containing protein
MPDQAHRNPDEERERHFSDLRALVQVFAGLVHSLDLDQRLQATLEGIQRIVQGDWGCFLLIEPGSSSLRLTHPTALPRSLAAELESLKFDFTRTESLHALSAQVRALLMAQSITSFLLVSLTARGKPIGLLLVGMRRDTMLAPATVDLITSLGEHIGMAIDNARLHTALAESEAWHRAFIENSPDAFWEGTVTGEITFVNDAACRIVGLDRETILGKRVEDFAGDDEETRRAAGAELRERGFLISRGGKLRTATGAIRQINYTTRLLRDPNGEPFRYQTIFRDITEQQELIETLSRRTQELAVLNRIAGILSHPLELDRALDQVCEQLTSITGMETAVIFLLNGSKQYMDIVAHRGVSDSLFEQARRVGLDDPMARRVALDGGLIAFNDVMLEYTGESFAGPRAEGYHAGIGVQILKRGAPIGVIFVGSKIKTSYEKADVNLLRNVASQIGVAIENADLFAQMQRRVRELDGLAQLSAASTTTLEPQTIAQTAVEWTRKLLEVDVADLRWLRGDALELMAAKAERSEFIQPAPIVLGDLLEGFTLSSFPLIVRDLESEADVPFVARQQLEPRGLRAMLVVPLAVRERVIGTMSVAHSQPRQWSQQEIHLLETIANQLANTLDSAQLFQRILSEQRKVQTIFDSGLSGLYATDAQGRIVTFNRAAERITGWTFDEVRDKKWEEVFGETKPLIRDALERKEPVFAPEGRELSTRDGRAVPVAEAAAPLFDEKGQVNGAVGAFWDLTREKQAELSREKFLTLVAHQLRSPLTAMLSSLQLLERQGLSKERRAELWTIVKGESERLKKFADEFLDLEAAVKSPHPIRMELLRVTDLARALIPKSQADGRGHRFRVRSAKPEPLVHADAGRVEDILRNLLDNAVSYSPADSVVTISIRPLDDNRVDVAVKDQGEGIPVEDQARIFEPFYRSAKTGGRHTYGHGLGLTIAKGMVEEMGGEIWVENQKRRGAIFHFTLRRCG